MTDRSRDEDAADEATTLSPRREARREVIDAVPGVAGADLDDATTLSPRRRGAPDDEPEDRTTLSRRHERALEVSDVPQIDDERTTLSRRHERPVEDTDVPQIDDERTTLSRRHERPVEDTDVPQVDDERTTLSRRHERPVEDTDVPQIDDERTTLSRRHERPVEDTDVPQIDDDRTSIAARRIEPPLEVSDIPRGSLEAAEATESPLDHTIVQRREVDTSITRGRADTPRTAAVPGATGSKAIYRPRADAPAPAITRTPVTPPTAVDPVGVANVRPRRRRGFLLALVAGVVVIVGGAITGIMLIVGGG